MGGLSFTRAAVIAPAGKLAADHIEAGCKVINKLGIDTAIMPNVLSDDGLPWHSATLENRLADLHAALNDPSIDLLWCVRGGVGSGALLPHIDWDLMRERNLPLIGYSDITALHLGMLSKQAGIPVIAPMIGKVPEATNSQYTFNSLKNFLCGRADSDIGSLTPMQRGQAEAFPVLANLTVMCSICGTGFMPDLSGKIVIFEDISEPPYRLDRCMVQLHQCGLLDNLAGLVFGGFSGCGKQKDLEPLQKYWAEKLSCPVWSRFPFAHEFPIASIRMDKRMKISSSGTVSIKTD